VEILVAIFPPGLTKTKHVRQRQNMDIRLFNYDIKKDNLLFYPLVIETSYFDEFHITTFPTDISRASDMDYE